MSLQTTYLEEVYNDRLNRSLVLETEPHFQDFDSDLLEQAESKAPKFTIHNIKLNQYLVIIDPFYVAQWGYEFDTKKLSQAIGLEAVQVFGSVAYFKSAFPLSTLEDSIKLSFV